MSQASLIDDLIRQHATFAVFRLPGGTALAYVQRSPVLVAPDPAVDCFVLAPFEGTDGPMCIRPDRILALTDETTLPDDPPPPETNSQDADPRPGLDRDGFRGAAASAIASVRAGKLRKVVLARTIATDLMGISMGALFTAAAQSLPHAFVAMARTDRFGLWMGASPERLLALHDGQLEVDAIAATRPVRSTPESPADWSMKEREEQAIVTRSIMNGLTAAGVGDAHAVGPGLKLAGNVAHLHTRITAPAAGSDPLALAKALHPTPAVGGHPQADAIALIRLLEPRPRSLYAGYWGPMGPKHADLFVNIRCMQVLGSAAHLHVGAGITAASDPDHEADEVEQKARLWLDLIEAQRRVG